MTDRDEFAKAAMNGLISSKDGLDKLKQATNILLLEGYPAEGVDVVAMVAYELADAMIRARAALPPDKPTHTKGRKTVVVPQNLNDPPLQ
jgi:hypothetical protein